MSNLLDVDKLSYLYSSGKGTKEVSFSIKKGDFIAIAGPNGAGKSTLLKLLVGKLKAQSGTICIDSQEIRNLSRKTFASIIAYITQSPATTAITVYDYISLGYYSQLPKNRFWLTKEEKKRIIEMMDFVGLSVNPAQKISELSGGERQLTQICRALLQNPKLLLMDEPVAHLDPGHAVTVLDLVDRLRREKGITILTVLHEINLAADYADRILFFNYGRLIADGTPQDLLTSSFLSELFGVEIAVEERTITKRPAIFPIPQRFSLLNR